MIKQVNDSNNLKNYTPIFIPKNQCEGIENLGGRTSFLKNFGLDSSNQVNRLKSFVGEAKENDGLKSHNGLDLMFEGASMSLEER